MVSDAEFNQMKSEILQFKKMQIDGFVFGILNEDQSVNAAQNSELVELANPIPCTFHRAFDVANDVSQSLEDVILCGFKTILTSGQENNVVEGMDTLAKWRKKQITHGILRGGGLRSSKSHR